MENEAEKEKAERRKKEKAMQIYVRKNYGDYVSLKAQATNAMKRAQPYIARKDGSIPAYTCSWSSVVVFVVVVSLDADVLGDRCCCWWHGMHQTTPATSDSYRICNTSYES